MSQQATSPNQSVVEVLRFGLTVWWEEIKWMLKGLFRRFEISRLEKELRKEYLLLGRIAENPRGRSEEKDLSLRQIKFLKEEIQTLETETAREREERMNTLRTKAGGPAPEDTNE